MTAPAVKGTPTTALVAEPATSVAVAVPSGGAAGDVYVIAAAVYGDWNNVVPSVSGFTLLADTGRITSGGNTDYRGTVLARAYTGSEGANFSLAVNSAYTYAACFLVSGADISGTNLANLVNASATAVTSSSATPAVTTTVANTLAVTGFAGGDHVATSVPSGWAGLVNLDGGYFRVAHKTQSTAGSTGTDTWGGTVHPSPRYTIALAPAPTSPREGASSGSWSFTGSAAGSTGKTGTGSGSFAFTGTAVGTTTRSGSAAGAWAFTGAAVGESVRNGSASGSWTFTGSASGTAPEVGMASGAASGTFTYTGTAAGERPAGGSAAGSWAFTGAAAGSTDKEGAASGAWTFTGTAAGSTVKTGTAVGAWSYTGTAAGQTVREGVAAGAWLYVGAAAGLTPPVYIDVGTPACRIRLIPADPRTRVVTAEPRTRTVPAEIRERVMTCPS